MYFRKTLNFGDIFYDALMELEGFIQNTKYQHDSRAPAIAWQVAVEAKKSVHKELKGIKAPFFTDNLRRAAIVTFKRRTMSADHREILLTISANHERLTSYAHGREEHSSQSD